MTTLKHSDRAKSNMLKQINAQIAKMQSIVDSKKKEYAKIKTYRKYKLPGQAAMEKAALSGLNQAKKQLAMLKARKAKLRKEGKIPRTG